MFILIFLIICFNTTVAASPYMIKTGDRLEINIWGHQDLQKKITVHTNGSIMFPLIGKVQLKGKSVSEVKNYIAGEMGRYIKNPDVIVTIIEPRVLNIGVFGGVNKEGVLTSTNPISLQEAISRAGGFMTDSDISDITIYTPDGNREINLETRPDLMKEVMLGDNYSIYIPRLVQRFSVIGEVKKPGSFKYEPGITILEAIARSGYLTEKADIEQIIVERFSPQKQRFTLRLEKEVSLDVSELNFELHPGDIIYIGQDKNLDLMELLRMVPFIKDLRDLIYR